jgi:signal transduction histidine kinase
MRFRTWPVAALGLGGLLVLVAVSLLTASRRAQDIYTQLEKLNAHHQEVENKLRRLRSDVHLSGIFVRDYLLDSERRRASESRAQLAEFRRANLATLAQLKEVASDDTSHGTQIVKLQAQLDQYWQSLDPLFDWTPSQKKTRSSAFLRQQVLPRREAAMNMAQEIERLNDSNLAAQRAEVRRRHASLREDLHTLLWQSLLLGLLVAAVAVARLSALERRSETERSEAEQAGRQMRELSQQLVATQEEERRKLSRELHDHVGQMVTALRMEIGHIERLCAPIGPRVAPAIAESRQLVDNVVRTVRDLALGLRPSMLDDFGLQPALEWHVRDFNRRYGLTADLTVDGHLERLTDQQRTCVYRVVQEALTNCARHAGATRISVSLSANIEGLDVVVADDGVGITDQRRDAGLGLRGIEERVKELNGTMAISGVPGRGTTLTVHLPDRIAEVTLARAAG